MWKIAKIKPIFIRFFLLNQVRLFESLLLTVSHTLNGACFLCVLLFFWYSPHQNERAVLCVSQNSLTPFHLKNHIKICLVPWGVLLISSFIQWIKLLVYAIKIIYLLFCHDVHILTLVKMFFFFYSSESQMFLKLLFAVKALCAKLFFFS